jgi:hypothetical protein
MGILIIVIYVPMDLPEKQIKAFELFRLSSLEMLHRRVEIEKQDFRKDSSFFPTPADHKANLPLSPTNVAPSVILEGEDYGLKASITIPITCQQETRAPRAAFDAHVDCLVVLPLIRPLLNSPEPSSWLQA